MVAITISIHALRVEGDGGRRRGYPRILRFLSTPSAWRATLHLQNNHEPKNISIHALRVEGDRPSTPPGAARALYFYPRPPRGGRRYIWDLDKAKGWGHFYPRPPRGGRPKDVNMRYLHANFYPRPPRGGRLSGEAVSGHAHEISIHALRVEGDAQFRVMGQAPMNISIHALRVEGDYHLREHAGASAEISIHALRVEGDRRVCGG